MTNSHGYSPAEKSRKIGNKSGNNSLEVLLSTSYSAIILISGFSCVPAPVRIVGETALSPFVTLIDLHVFDSSYNLCKRLMWAAEG